MDWIGLINSIIYELEYMTILLQLENTQSRMESVRPELQSRVNNGCITFIQSPLSLVVIVDQSCTDRAF